MSNNSPGPRDAGSMFEVCVCYLIRPGESGPEVLLGKKKFGIGAGNLVGPGGKLEVGETAIDAVRREVREETSLDISNPMLVGELNYPFPFRPAWSQKSWVFVCEEFAGTARESDELSPEWFAIDSVPVDHMWDDAKYWLPALLRSSPLSSATCSTTRVSAPMLTATFEFGPDLRTVSSSDHPAFRLG